MTEVELLMKCESFVDSTLPIGIPDDKYQEVVDGVFEVLEFLVTAK